MYKNKGDKWLVVKNGRKTFIIEARDHILEPGERVIMKCAGLLQAKRAYPLAKVLFSM